MRRVTVVLAGLVVVDVPDVDAASSAGSAMRSSTASSVATFTSPIAGFGPAKGTDLALTVARCQPGRRALGT
jgi:hypothetical protein